MSTTSAKHGENSQKDSLVHESDVVNIKNALQKALILLNLSVRAYSALYMIISDCDETFNYWEPLNLLVRGFGKETWEYSPEYAIRSYAYLAPYYIINAPMSFIVKALQLPSYYQFYWIRLIALCGVTSIAEIKLSSSLLRNFNLKIANWFLFFSSVSTGMSHAGVALLPSSFAMQTTLLATSYSLDATYGTYGDKKVIKASVFAIAAFLVGGICGWPFTLALAVPFGSYTVLSSGFSSRFYELSIIVLKSIVALAGISLIVVGIDSYFYQFDHYIFVPLNIVLYNVFGGEGEGPEIFGVEPFSYYILNLLVNFNIIAVLGYGGLFINTLVYENKYRIKAIVGITLPLLLWSVIFGSQPHKEERFLYPIYPLINAGAALFVSKIFHFFKLLVTKLSTNRTFTKSLSFIAQSAFVLLVGIVSILRTVNLVENYSAPLTASLAFDHTSNHSNVCIGREWYHFPTSFFLPDNYRLRFVTSGFDGLLPGDFLEGDDVTLSQSTSSIPEDMNNLNQFSASKLFPLAKCDFYIDNTQNVNIEIGEAEVNKVEGGKVSGKDGWEIVSCQKLINPDGHHRGLGRLIYIPKFLRHWIPYEVEYMDYCVSKRIDNVY